MSSSTRKPRTSISKGEASEKEITINLDILSSMEDMPSDSLIFRNQFDTLVRKILKTAKKNIEEKGKQDIGSRSCFFIDGTRGSGKSTLLRAIRKKLTSQETRKENKISIVSLADIDPTELAKGENFLMYVLGKIHHMADDFSKEHAYETDVHARHYQEAMECIRSMSGGLHLILDAENSLLKSDDPEYFIEESVEKCASSSELRSNLNKLLENVCAIVGADVFLITVDDADMNFGKCVSVLEYVRKYMHSPRLIFLFAGDMQLYTHVVRGMQIGNFEQELFKYDNSQQMHRIEMLDRLEDQYLLKFFPVDNRVNLGSFCELINSENRVTIQHSDAEGNEQKVELNDILSQKLGVITEKAFIPIIKQFIGAFPLRSALSLLKLWQSGDESSTPTTRLIADGIRQVALQNLIKHNVNYTELAGGNLPGLLHAIIHHMATPELNCSHQDLLPSSGNIDLFFPSFYLSAEVAHHARSYAAKLIYLCTLFPNWYTIESAYHRKQMTEHKVAVLRQHELDALNNIQSSGHAEWSAHATECMALYNENSPGTTYGFGFGTIRLLKNAQQPNKEQGSVHRHSVFGLLKMLAILSNPNKELNLKLDIKMDKKMEMSTSPKRMLCLALLHTLCGVTVGQATRYYLSIFNLILLAADLLEFNPHDNDLEEKVHRRLTSGYLPCTVRYHSIPDAEDQEKFGARDSFATTRNSFGEFSKTLIDKEVKSVCKWIKDYAEASYISTAKALQLCWEEFCAHCETNTADFLPEYYSPNVPPTAGKLLAQYMAAFESAVQTHLPHPERKSKKGTPSLAACLQAFPLWAVLKDKQDGVLYTTLEKTHIVDLKNKDLIQEFHVKSKAVKDTQSYVAKLENSLRTQKKEIEEKQQLIAIANGEFSDFADEEKNAYREKSRADRAYLATRRGLEEIENEKKELLEKLNDLEQQHNTYNVQQNMALQVNLQHLNTNTAQLAELEDLKQRVDSKTNELAAAEENYQKEKEGNSRMRLEFICFTLKREVAELQARLDNLRQVQANTQKEFTASQRRYEELKEQCVQTIDELNKKRELSARVSAKRERTYTELDMRRATLERTHKVWQETKARKEASQAHLGELRDNLAMMEQRYQACEQELEVASIAQRTAQISLSEFNKEEKE